MKRIIVTFCISLLLISTLLPAYARKSASAIPIVGCYSDAKLLENEGMVIGKGQYVATFSELMHDGGESYPDVTVEKLVVNESKGIIIFDLALHSGRDVMVLHQVTGNITRTGIKMNWRGHAAEHGHADPFMKRQKCKARA